MAGNIFECARAGDNEGVRQAIAEGADVNAKDAEGKTALMHAVIGKHATIVRILLGHKASVNAVDNKGKTARDYASGGNANIIGMLKKAGNPTSSGIASLQLRTASGKASDGARQKLKGLDQALRKKRAV
ncbi:ankyrin repeat domain-containing protein [Candidatus Micrarchaeota archaeon]|nr:ankyrin repeat domain-containing protein [Candidatus Micrarchaeota archaeon]